MGSDVKGFQYATPAKLSIQFYQISRAEHRLLLFIGDLLYTFVFVKSETKGPDLTLPGIERVLGNTQMTPTLSGDLFTRVAVMSTDPEKDTGSPETTTTGEPHRVFLPVAEFSLVTYWTNYVNIPHIFKQAPQGSLLSS